MAESSDAKDTYLLAHTVATVSEMLVLENLRACSGSAIPAIYPTRYMLRADASDQEISLTIALASFTIRTLF